MRGRKEANAFYSRATGVVLVAIACLSFGVWYFRPPLPDAETLCPTTRPITAHTLVIVDRTDRWNPVVGDTLADLLEKAQKETQKFEKFSIVSLDSDLATRPLFSVCNPGEPNFMTDLYRGRRYTRRDFDQRFVGAAEEVLAEVREPREADASPIVEYMHRWLGSDDFNANVPNRRVILISDMRQNSSALSVYRDNGGAALPSMVEREFGDAGKSVVYDVYFIAHGHDYNVPESDVRAAWEGAFQQLAATYEWRQLN
jgi:hypothetical protein